MHSTNQILYRHADFAQCYISLRTVKSQNFVKIVGAVEKIAKNLQTCFFPSGPPKFVFFEKIRPCNSLLNVDSKHHAMFRKNPLSSF